MKVAESAVARDFPYDSFELEDARRITEAGRPVWLVHFGFANDEGSACVLVPLDGTKADARLVECAFYLD